MEKINIKQTIKTALIAILIMMSCISLTSCSQIPIKALLGLEKQVDEQEELRETAERTTLAYLKGKYKEDFEIQKVVKENIGKKLPIYRFIFTVRSLSTNKTFDSYFIFNKGAAPYDYYEREKFEQYIRDEVNPINEAFTPPLSPNDEPLFDIINKDVDCAATTKEDGVSADYKEYISKGKATVILYIELNTERRSSRTTPSPYYQPSAVSDETISGTEILETENSEETTTEEAVSEEIVSEEETSGENLETPSSSQYSNDVVVISESLLKYIKSLYARGYNVRVKVTKGYVVKAIVQSCSEDLLPLSEIEDRVAFVADFETEY